MQTTPARTAFGVALSAAILLAYGLFRPGSLEFSIPFLMAPSIALLWTVAHDATGRERRIAVAVTWVVVVAAAATVLIDRLP